MLPNSRLSIMPYNLKLISTHFPHLKFINSFKSQPEHSHCIFSNSLLLHLSWTFFCLLRTHHSCVTRCHFFSFFASFHKADINFLYQSGKFSSWINRKYHFYLFFSLCRSLQIFKFLIQTRKVFEPRNIENFRLDHKRLRFFSHNFSAVFFFTCDSSVTSFESN